MKEKEFKEFYDQYFKYIFNYLKKRVFTKEDCEDIATEIFNAMWQTWENIDKQKNIKALLFKITLNKLNDFFRKKYSTYFNSQNFDEELEEVFAENQTDIIQKSNDSKMILKELLKNLSEEENLFFEYKYKQNFSYTELAKALNISVGNAKIKNNRLVKKLKSLWEQDNLKLN